MTHIVLEASILGTLRAYWRINAALAIYREFSAHDELGVRAISYDMVPQHGVATMFIINESVSQATDEVAKYARERLSTDLFLALIAHFESFLSHIVTRAGQSPNGTLGTLQTTVQGLHTIPQVIIEDFDEVRERRNTLIHNHGVVTPRYRIPASRVFARSAGCIPDPATVMTIGVPSGYLSYVADVLIRYARVIP